MCYSRDWRAEEDRKRQEARDAKERRTTVINELRSEAEKVAEKARKDVPQTLPAK